MILFYIQSGFLVGFNYPFSWRFCTFNNDIHFYFPYFWGPFSSQQLHHPSSYSGTWSFSLSFFYYFVWFTVSTTTRPSNHQLMFDHRAHLTVCRSIFVLVNFHFFWYCLSYNMKIWVCSQTFVFIVDCSSNSFLTNYIRVSNRGLTHVINLHETKIETCSQNQLPD